MLPPARISLLWLLSSLLLAGCDALGLPNPAKEAAQAEADAKAVGASCRHSGRALEDCFALNPDQSRAHIYAGWKEMHDYMAAGNIAVVPPLIEKEVPKHAGDEEEAHDEPVRKSSGKKTDKDGEEDSEPRSSKGKSADAAHAKADQ